MNKLVREILFLKRGERRALFVVSILLFLSLGFRVLIPNIGKMAPEPDFAFQEQMERLRQELDSLEKTRIKAPKRPSLPPPKISPRQFDPNSVSREELSAMYFPEKVISNILGYRKAGGVFYSRDDLKKIYSLDDQLYETIKDYVDLAVTSPKEIKASAQKIPEQAVLLPVELNTVDSAGLVKIRGIGPFSARTIIRYRNLLGGYYALAQLMEVYGMDSLRYELLCETVYIDSSFIVPLDINDLSYGELLSHPYFSKQQVADLIHYRDYAKVIVSPEELKKFGIFDSTSFLRIAPYIRCRIN